MRMQRFTAQLGWELGEIRNDLRSLQFYRMLGTMAGGLVLCAVAVNGILIPNHFFSGGTSGLSLMVYYLADWPSLGMIYLIMNIPLFVIGWREYALRYVLVSVTGVLIFSLALDLTTWVEWRIDDRLISAILAGILIGAGTGIYLREGGSGGGMDILAKFIRKRLSIPMGTTMNMVNVFNLTGAWLIYDLETAFYSGVYMWVLAFVLDKVLTGLSQNRGVFIITSLPEAVSSRIQRELERGVTFLHASGGYSHRSMRMIYTVINLYELGRLKQIIFDLDPASFMIVSEASEVIGRRFHSFEDEGYRHPFVWHPAPPSR
jgi:uncharacterized membrane-anchored protein YitT (DUF2179 family)